MAPRDELGAIFREADFAALFPARDRPVEAPRRLALVTGFQFDGRPSDRRAADAVRGRIDRKYTLGLGLGDPCFGASVLCEFLARLAAGSAEGPLLDAPSRPCRGRARLGVRVIGLRRSRHVGRAMTHLQHLAAAAINIVRVVDWLAGRDREGARMSGFVRLMTAAVPA